MDGGGSPACFLSLVIPAYNEARGIAHAIAEADAALAQLGVRYEIIVVDDGSRDATAPQVEQAARQYPSVRLVRHQENRGYGAALRSGFEAARGERIAFTDADCQFFLADLDGLLRRTGDRDIAIGWRMDRQDSRLRKFYSRGYNLVARTLLGTRARDIDCALKVFRRDALARILPTTSGFFVNAEMLTRARQLGLTVAEIGVRHRPRLCGSSKVSVVDIPRTLAALVPFWWMKVLFAGANEPPGRSPAARWRLFDVGAATALLLVAALLFYGRLGAPLLEPEEARYAEIPRQMLAQGQLITPVLHGEAYYHKPPLLYWLVMGCYQVFGIHDWAARLVPATAGILIVLLTYLWAARTVGRGAALAGAGMLCLSAKFLYQSGMLTFDSLTALWVLASLAAAHLALLGPKLRLAWWTLAALACGLGILSKGPVAPALVLPPLVIWQVLDRRGARLQARDWALFIGIACGVAAPWFVALLWRDASAFFDFFWTHNLVRYVRPLDHQEPVWFYVLPLLVGMLPWSLLVFPLGRHLARRSIRTARRRPASLGFFLLALVWCFAFFSLSGCKRQGYMLPAFPLLALVLGTYVANAVAWRPLMAWQAVRVHPAWNLLAHRATLATLVLAVCVGAAAGLRGIWAWPVTLLWGLFLSIGIIALARRGPSRLAWRTAGLCGLTMFALLLVAVHEVLPSYHRLFALRGQVRRHRDLTEGSALPVASYPKRWDSVSFYLQRDDVEAYSFERRADLIHDLRQQGRTLLFVKQGAPLDDLLDALPEDLEFTPRGRAGAIVVPGIVQVKGK